VEFLWPREPTDEDRNRCFVVVSVGDSHVEVAAMSLQGMAALPLGASGPRSVQLTTAFGVSAASNENWQVEAATGGKQYRCRVRVGLANRAGLVAVPTRPRRPQDAWVQLFDFGVMPPATLSEPLKQQLSLP
jgi:hypothetical protein